jgi:hypothetical protein
MRNTKAFTIAYNSTIALVCAVAFVAAFLIFIMNPLGFWLGLAYIIAMLANMYVFGDCIYDIVVAIDEG